LFLVIHDDCVIDAVFFIIVIHEINLTNLLIGDQRFILTKFCHMPSTIFAGYRHLILSLALEPFATAATMHALHSARHNTRKEISLEQVLPGQGDSKTLDQSRSPQCDRNASTSVSSLIDELHTRAIEIWLDGGQLRYRAPPGAITPELISRLKTCKDELILRLQVARGQTITRLPDQFHYEVSHAQRRIWVLSQIDTASTAYNIPFRLALEGPLEHIALHKTFNAIEERHEILRTTMTVIDGELRQIVHPPGAVGLHLREIDFSIETDPETSALRFADTDATEPFDIERGPLVRTTLLQLGPRKHLLCLTAHHLVCDGWSLRVLMRDFSAIYQAACAGSVAALAPLAIQYRDYSAWGNRAWATDEALKHKSYWLRKLAGRLPVLDLASDAPRPGFQTFRGDVFTLHFQLDEARRLSAFARSRQCSVFAVLLALIKALLYRHTGQRDVIVGTAVAGRGLVELEDQIGCYINTLPLRSRIDSSSSFDTIVRNVRQTLMEALDHQDYPFDHLIDALKLPRDFSRSPLFDVMVVSQSAESLDAVVGDLRASHLPLHTRVSKYDLTFDCEEALDAIHVGIEYSSDLFTRARIERLGEHLHTLALNVMNHPERPVGDLPMMRADEWNTVVRKYNPSTVRHSADTVVERIEKTARRCPNRIAVACGEDRWTYAELQEHAQAIAGALRAQSVARGDVVGVLAKRSPRLVAALLGVLQAGAAYLPLDETYPQQRLVAMIDDCGTRLVLCDTASRPLLPEAIPVIDLDKLSPHSQIDTPAKLPRPSDLAYVIYTSGSTGRPKGVQIPHEALANFLASMEHQPGLQESDVLLALTTVCFDIAALELFLPLCVGARLIIAPRSAATDSEALQDLIERENITVLQATPAGWRTLIAAGWDGCPKMRAFCGGEALTTELAKQLANRVAEVWNLYGPTETACWSAAQRLASSQRIQARHFSTLPIGAPIANTQLYSLDARLTPMPLGFRGELYIGGAGVAWGYRGRPALTAEKFLPDPFSTTPGARMYRTGDLVQSAEDGTFDFLGRNDQQVKIRGFRIELGEIEAALEAHPEVIQAVVTARADVTGEMTLAAYLVPAPGREAVGVRDFLAGRLPVYMIPAVYVLLPRLPLTANGKIDRRALPAPIEPKISGRVAPRNPLEQKLAALWETVLGIEGPGIYDGFFELGGQSLRAVKLLTAIKREFGISVLSRDFFANSTIAWLAQTLAQSEPVKTPARARIGKAAPLASDEHEPENDAALLGPARTFDP
jgi:amino acid adenylation domain-containing protein